MLPGYISAHQTRKLSHKYVLDASSNPACMHSYESDWSHFGNHFKSLAGYTKYSCNLRHTCIVFVIILNWASLAGSWEGHGLASSSVHFGHLTKPTVCSPANSSPPFFLHGKIAGASAFRWFGPPLPTSYQQLVVE